MITSTSLDIAERTGKRHDNVVRDIKKMFKGLEIDALKSEGNSETPNSWVSQR